MDISTIQVGDSKDHVLAALGEPWDAHTDSRSGTEAWDYIPNFVQALDDPSVAGYTVIFHDGVVLTVSPILGLTQG